MYYVCSIRIACTKVNVFDLCFQDQKVRSNEILVAINLIRHF